VSSSIPADDEKRWDKKLVEARLTVRLLIDENLPRSLKYSLRDLFPDSAHVGDLDLLSAPDTDIWERAKAFHFAILTKDKDFAERVRMEGAPPVVIQIRAGNCSVVHLVSLIREHAGKIRTAVQYGGPLVEIAREVEAAAKPREQ
jgi:predicted nuclease of predicted toxin-antitoxin system